MRRLLLSIFVLLLWMTNTAKALELPVRQENGRIVVRAESGMGDLAKKVANEAPGFLEAIAEDLPGLPVPPIVEIRLVKRASSLPAAAPAGRGAPSWASGVAYSDLGIVTIAYRNGSNINDVSSVVAHELAHLALGSALHGRAPRWLNEGFAYLHSSDWSMERTQVLTGLAWSGSIIPLYELDDSFPAEELEVHKAYAQSYDLVGFLARRGRYADVDDDGDRWPFRHFLARIAAGDEPEEAALQAYGANLRTLFSEWYENLRSRYMMVPASLVSLFVWCFAAFLLILGYLRKNRNAKRILARWEAEENARAEALTASPAP